MGSGNAVRVTEPETFTLIQLEEERQKLKKKELLKNMLTDSEFSIKGQCAINLMMTKIDIIGKGTPKEKKNALKNAYNWLKRFFGKAPGRDGAALEW